MCNIVVLFFVKAQRGANGVSYCWTCGYLVCVVVLYSWWIGQGKDRKPKAGVSCWGHDINVL